MSELECLNGYTGQTVEQLLALEGTYRIDSLLWAFEAVLEQKISNRNLENLTFEEQTVMAVESLEREVNNGGYHQFFLNTPEYAPIIQEALGAIGCPKFAQITRDAITALRLRVVSIAEIENIIYDDDEPRDAALSACDDRFYEYPESIEERLFAFIKANKRKISF